MKILILIIFVCSTLFSQISDAASVYATISDADGFTNIREKPSKNSEVIGIIKEGEVFETARSSESWWSVTTRDGKKGYVHSSRIKLLDDQAKSQGDSSSAASELKKNTVMQRSGFKNLSEVLLRVPTMVEDDTLRARLAAAPIDTTVAIANTSANGCVFDRKELTKEEYFTLFNNLSLKTMGWLKQNPRVYESLMRGLKEGGEKTKVFADEVNDPDNEIFITGTGQTIAGDDCFWIACASGVIIAPENPEEFAIFIPRNILMRAKEVTRRGGRSFGLRGLDGASAIFLETDSGEFAMPANTHLTFDTRRLAEAFASSFRLHQLLYNLSALQEHLAATQKTEPVLDGPKLIGYAGLSLGMAQQDALSIVRESLNYSNTQALKQFECESPKSIKNERWKSDILEYVSDLQIASGGLTLAPPWTIALALPKESSGQSITIAPADVFIFQDSKLVVCARYMNVRSIGGGDLYAATEQKPPRDTTQMDALFSKYGDPTSVTMTASPQSSFQLVWNESLPKVGAIFRFNGANFKMKPGSLTPQDRVASLPNGGFVFNRGNLVPIAFDEIDMAHSNDYPPSLVCAFYWTPETAASIQANYKRFSNQQQQQQQEQRNESVNKAMDSL